MTNEKEKHTPLPWQSDYTWNMITDCVPSAGYTFDKVICHIKQSHEDTKFILKACNSYYEREAVIKELVADNYTLRSENAKLIHQLKKCVHQLAMRKDRTKSEDEAIETGRKLSRAVRLGEK